MAKQYVFHIQEHGCLHYQIEIISEGRSSSGDSEYTWNRFQASGSLNNPPITIQMIFIKSILILNC